MIKQYFADGMISIAIILSLLRTDIHQYLNNSLINYPEIHDIILGTSTAYSQTTNFHNNNYINNVGGFSLHPKNIENEYFSSNILSELRSLNRFRRFHGLNTNINAFLVNPPTSVVSHATNAETENIPVNPSESSSSDTVESSSSPSEDVNNNLSSSNTSVAQPNNTEISLSNSSDNNEDFNGAFSLHPSHNVLTDAFSNSTVTASNLTNEDLDLIETLWRQDIDLGIGKEVFDLNLRRELERERELELQKQRQKQKELELLQYKLEEERRQQAQNWIAQNFVQDGETGEWIAVNSSAPDLNGNSTTQDNELSFEEAFRILDGVANAPLSNESQTITDLDEYMGNVTADVSSSYLQNVSSDQAQIDQLIETAQSFNESEINPVPGVAIQRQVSIEQHWQDLVSVLNLTSAANNTNSEPMDTAELSPETSLPAEDTSVLLQNATMPQPILNTTTPLQPFSNTTFMPPADVYTNTSGSLDGVTSPVVWNTGDMSFPNLTTSLNQSDVLDSVDDILPDLLTGSELENITLNVDDMDLTDSLQCLQMVDEVSSDSAVSSMDSMASPANDFNETDTLGSMSPFDGVEGATGGSEYTSSGDSKLGKYDPEDYGYSYSPYDTGDYNDQSNYSSSSNDTHHFQQPDLNQVQHNHTYPLQPGSQPKETKSSSNKPRQKGPHSRDEKRAREMKLPLPVESIIRAPVDEFNEIVAKYKLTEPQLQLIRDIRRRGKNKVAAQNCRKRKLDSIFTLEDELNNLKEIKDRLMRERHMIDKETRDMKGKFHHLYQEVFQSLRDEHGQPYDPNEFSLQETSDGNVFLVPRNGTSNHGRKDFNRKRKDKR